MRSETAGNVYRGLQMVGVDVSSLSMIPVDTIGAGPFLTAARDLRIGFAKNKTRNGLARDFSLHHSEVTDKRLCVASCIEFSYAKVANDQIEMFEAEGASFFR